MISQANECFLQVNLKQNSLYFFPGTKVVLYLPSCYKKKVNGLCGEFGGYALAPDQPDAILPTAWRVDPTCPIPPEGTVFNPCKVRRNIPYKILYITPVL